jgi:putative PIN family toxin of toxin-antitoxin system
MGAAVIRAVVDTNILVSALLSPQGPPAQVLLMAIVEPDIRLCVSADVFAEYEEVIRRPRLHRSEAEIEAILRAVRAEAFWVKPATKVYACSDPDDDIFLECAQTADAHYLVTGNTKHFPAKWGNTQVVTARQFLDAEQ